MTVHGKLTGLLATVGVLSVVALNPVAFAADAVGPDQPDAPQSGSVTINKLVASEGVAGDGTEQTVAGDPLSGVEFSIWRLGVKNDTSCEPLDLSKNESWSQVPSQGAPNSIAEVEQSFCLVGGEALGVETTDTNGQIKFDNLPLGLYYIQETNTPDNVISKAAPFYVTVPLPHETLGWLYDIHVYPKSLVMDAPEKVVNADEDQEGLTVGSQVKYTISQAIPTLGTDETYQSVSVWDTLPNSDTMAFGETLSVDLIRDSDQIPFVADVDYIVTQAQNSGGEKTTWSLTDTGRGKLQAGDTLQIVFTATVNQVVAGGGIENPGNDGSGLGYGSEINGGKTPGDPNSPYTYWGTLKVIKTDTESHTLAGAEFQVAALKGDSCPAQVSSQDIVSKGTTGKNGIVAWDRGMVGDALGLFIGNSTGPLVNPTAKYCLYETKAPAGYTPNPVQEVTIGAGINTTPASGDLVVENTRTKGPTLPLTGAQGTVLLTVLGAILMVSGIAVYRGSKNRHS